MSNKIPTAEEFLEKAGKGKGYLMLDRKEFTDCMKKFAERHTQAALKAASEQAKLKYQEFGDLELEGIDKKSILSAYPKENII